MSSKSHLIFTILIAFTAASVCCENSDQNNQLVSDYENRQWKMKKQNQYLIPIGIAVVVAKLIILPVIFKGLAMMSGVSIIMSIGSLVLSALAGFSNDVPNFSKYTNNEKNDKIYRNDHTFKNDVGTPMLERYVTEAGVEYPTVYQNGKL